MMNWDGCAWKRLLPVWRYWGNTRKTSVQGDDSNQVRRSRCANPLGSKSLVLSSAKAFVVLLGSSNARTRASYFSLYNNLATSQYCSLDTAKVGHDAMLFCPWTSAINNLRPPLTHHPRLLPDVITSFIYVWQVVEHTGDGFADTWGRCGQSGARPNDRL